MYLVCYPPHNLRLSAILENQGCSRHQVLPEIGRRR